jgi:hypothetical protein
VPKPSRFALRLGAITVAALVGRVVFVLLARRHTPAWGDSFSYHYGANLLAHGKGFIDPARYSFFGIVTPSAYHPPLYTVYLALWTRLGVSSVLGHRIVSCLLGAAVVAVVGLIGRELGTTPARGERIGLVAATAAALSPALWINDASLLSEPAAELVVVLALLVLLRYRARPSTAKVVGIGLLLGLAALSRAELLLLLPLASIGVRRWAAPQTRATTVRSIVVLGLAGAAVVGPWVGYNLTRFDKPVYISTGLGATLGGGACDAAFHGQKIGYWDAATACGAQQVAIALPASVNAATASGRAAIAKIARAQLAHEGDESVRESESRTHAIDYLRAHQRWLPVVVAARVGRLWGVFRPWQTARFDATIEGRGFFAARLALIGYWLLAVASLPGLVLLHRRKQPIGPFLAVAFIVTFAAAVSFGVQRYRAPFDAVMPVLAAVALEELWFRIRGRSRATIPPS